MEQIVVHRINGQSLNLFSRTQGSAVTSAEQVVELLAGDVVNIQVTSSTALPFAIGEYVEVFGSKYSLNAQPVMKKNHDREFEYSLRFEGAQYRLIKVRYLDVDEVGFSTGSAFSLMGNLEDFAKLIIQNALRVYGEYSWELGECPVDTLTQNLSFSDETCLQVLQSLCETYEQEFDIERLPFDRYRLHIRKRETIMPDTFKYGRTKGLYQLERNNANSKNIVTRLFAYGSQKNLPLNYRYGATRLKMMVSDIFSEGQPYIQDNAGIAKYGIIEGSVIFDDIYPHRTGKVTGIDTSNRLVFYDLTMPFNLTAVDGQGDTIYLIPGMAAKIVFQSGNLAGYEFSIESVGGYIDTEKKFTLISYTDERGAIFPSVDTDAFRVMPGDEYVIVDITLPQAYINEAEYNLTQKAYEYLANNSLPRIQYSLTIDQNFIASKAPSPDVIINYFTVGEYLKVIDIDMGIDGRSKIQAFTRDLLQHYKYSLTLGEEYLKIAGRAPKGYLLDRIKVTNGIETVNAGRARTLSMISTYIGTGSGSGSGGGSDPWSSPITTQTYTYSLYVGSEEDTPEGFITIEPDVTPILQITDNIFSNASILGPVFIDRVPYMPVGDGIELNGLFGMLDLTGMDGISEGSKLVITVKK